MHRTARIVSIALAIALIAAARSARAAASACSADAFTIDGSAVAVRVCLTNPPAPSTHRGPPAKAPPGALEETFTVKGQAPFVRTLALDAAPTDEASRTIDDVPLQKLGLARTLHLTLEVRESGVRVEHALLVPGAVTLK